MRWSVAVTTAPRKDNILDQCLESLQDAGFTHDEITVFAEPNSPPTPDHNRIDNEKRLGVWYNWKQAAHRCLAFQPDLVMTVQDDAIFHPESKQFVESILWPDPLTGYISLYTPSHYQQYKDGRLRPFGVYAVNTGSVWGAMSLVFPPTTLANLLQHHRALSWCGSKIRRAPEESKHDYLLRWEAVRQRRLADTGLIQNSDTIIGIILRRYMKRRLMYISPSLVSHAAKHSSIGHGGNGGKRNTKYLADHSLPLSHQIPTTPRAPISLGDL